MENVLPVLGMVWLPLLLSMLTAYLLGSLDFAIIVTKAFTNEDIREKGSGNAGATNVLRSHGKKLAGLTSLGDVGKAVASVLLAWLVWFPLFNVGYLGYYAGFIAGAMCVLGHMYPLYFGFRGGKGVLTVLGMMLVLDWSVALIGLAVFVVVVALSKMVSLGSILAGVSLCISVFIHNKFILHSDTATTTFVTSVVVFVVSLAVMKHSENIKRILNGTENKLGQKKTRR